ncbi:MAG: translation initiation factor IF-2 subunit beta [Thermoplasmata archaeon]
MPTYEELLEHAKKELPETSPSLERFQVPEAVILLEGQITVLRNFADIADAINRKPKDLFAFLLKELGTSGSLEGRRALFKGRLSADKINKRILSYVDEYVLCAECNRPDTHIVKEGRIAILQCDACGARRSLRVIKKAAKTEEPILQVGKTYEVMIQDIGKKGDGVARRENYVIYVPGTTKGIVVKIEVEKIVGNVAFAKLAPE